MGRMTTVCTLMGKTSRRKTDGEDREQRRAGAASSGGRGDGPGTHMSGTTLARRTDKERGSHVHRHRGRRAGGGTNGSLQKFSENFNFLSKITS